MIKHRLIEIIIQNTGARKKYQLGTTLHEIIKDINLDLKYPIIGAMVNNKLKELDYAIFKPKTIKFIDQTHPDGMRMYVRSLSFILIKAVKNLFPNRNVKIEHSVSNGYYCEFEGINKELSVFDIVAIQGEMKRIVDADIPFEREEILTEEAIELFE